MSALADLPELVGYFSYARGDDEHSAGALSRLRARIQDELRLQLGRSFRLWQDTAAIPHGALWKEEIAKAIGESVFFIPIVTPRAVASEHCRFELESFLKREAALGRANLIFPIRYIGVPALESEQQWRHDELLKIIGTRPYVDWQKFQHCGVGSVEVAEKIENFCRNVLEALRQPLVPPDDGRNPEELVKERPSVSRARADKVVEPKWRERVKDLRVIGPAMSLTIFINNRFTNLPPLAVVILATAMELMVTGAGIIITFLVLLLLWRIVASFIAQ